MLHLLLQRADVVGALEDTAMILQEFDAHDVQFRESRVEEGLASLAAGEEASQSL
jgi:hypothetical protein